jgi:hypothetical protein
VGRRAHRSPTAPNSPVANPPEAEDPATPVRAYQGLRASQVCAVQVNPPSVVTSVSVAEVQSDLYAAHDVVELTTVPIVGVEKLADPIPTGSVGLVTWVHVPPPLVDVNMTWPCAKTQSEFP